MKSETSLSNQLKLLQRQVDPYNPCNKNFKCK